MFRLTLNGAELGEATMDDPSNIFIHPMRVVPVDYGPQGIVSFERVLIGSKGAPFDLHT